MDLVLVGSDSREKDDPSVVSIDPVVVQNIGVKTEVATMRVLDRTIRTSATIAPDERLQSVVSARSWAMWRIFS